MSVSKPYGENRTVKLTTSWQRYSISGVIPAKVRDGYSIFEVRLMERGTMWADNAQLERGGEATEYEE